MVDNGSLDVDSIRFTIDAKRMSGQLCGARAFPCGAVVERLIGGGAALEWLANLCSQGRSRIPIYSWHRFGVK